MGDTDVSAMTLVERLRELGFSGNELGHEAADEIERLSHPRGDYSAWLIEWPEDNNVPVRWWNPSTGWMRDANKAIWMVRESDATDYIASHKFVAGVKPTEHVFVTASPISFAECKSHE